MLSGWEAYCLSAFALRTLRLAKHQNRSSNPSVLQNVFGKAEHVRVLQNVHHILLSRQLLRQHCPASSTGLDREKDSRGSALMKILRLEQCTVCTERDIHIYIYIYILYRSMFFAAFL